MPPLIDADDTVVNTPALRRLEPYLSDVVLRSVRSAPPWDEVAPTSPTGGHTSVLNVCGAMNSAAQVNCAGTLTSLEEPRSALGKVLAAAEISPLLVASKVVHWGGGSWPETLTAAQGFGQAALAVAVLRTKVEAGFDYVALVWRSRL